MEEKKSSAPQIPMDQFIEAAALGLMRAVKAHGATSELAPQALAAGSQVGVVAQGHWIIGLVYQPQLAARPEEVTKT